MATAINPSKSRINDTSTIETIIAWIRSIISIDPISIPNYFDDEIYRRQQIRKKARERINRIRNQMYRQW